MKMQSHKEYERKTKKIISMARVSQPIVGHPHTNIDQYMYKVDK
jgi:hypothetical protein